VIVVMDKKNSRNVADVADAMGIVVKNGRPAQARPRTAAFVWGAGVFAPPSLPYGRWKVPARSVV
jgi:hypothetical protein